MSSSRTDGRAPEAMRPISFQRRFTSKTPGSVLASFGDTQVLCTASLMDGVPRFLQGKGKGWLTAEYSMMPSSTDTRKARDRNGRVDRIATLSKNLDTNARCDRFLRGNHAVFRKNRLKDRFLPLLRRRDADHRQDAHGTENRHHGPLD